MIVQLSPELYTVTCAKREINGDVEDTFNLGLKPKEPVMGKKNSRKKRKISQFKD